MLLGVARVMCNMRLGAGLTCVGCWGTASTRPLCGVIRACATLVVPGLAFSATGAPRAAGERVPVPLPPSDSSAARRPVTLQSPSGSASRERLFSRMPDAWRRVSGPVLRGYDVFDQVMGEPDGAAEKAAAPPLDSAKSS